MLSHYRGLPRQLKKRQADRLEELVRQYYPEILRYAAWRMRDAHMAEDVTQEVFVKAVRYLDYSAKQAKFRALLYKIAGNLCIDILRKRPEEQLPVHMAFAERGYERVEARCSMEWMMKELTPGQREIVWLRYGGRLKLREIADVMSLPLRTVQSRMRTALKLLGEKLKEEGHVAYGQKTTRQIERGI